MPKGAPAPAPFDPWLAASTAFDVALASHADVAGLAARRAQRLARLIGAAAERSPLYRRLIGRRDTASLRLADLPAMRKAELMRHFDDWVADPRLHLHGLRRFVADPAHVAGAYLGRYMVWESSGSSGEPAIFVQDAAAMAVYDALEAVRRPRLQPLQWLQDPLGLGERIAFVGATDGHFASTVTMERLRRLNPTLGGRLSLVSFLQPVGAIVAQLNDAAPTVIATYPTGAVLLAQERMAGRLRVALHELWTGGETLSPGMRDFVGRAFGCPVSNSYGASEFIALASECRYGALHLNADWVILEPVDSDGRPVPPGEDGATTLLTNLANHVQPLIRCDLGDRVALEPQRCACGSNLPVIRVQGRSDDMLHLAARGARRVSVLPLALVSVLEQEAGLFDFQLVQRGPRDLLLRTGQQGDAVGAALQRGREALAAFLAVQGASGVGIECRSGEPGTAGRSGKVPRVLALRHG